MRMPTPLLRKLFPILVTSLLVTVVVVGMRQFGLLESVELATYDFWMQHRPAEKPDPRLLLVQITEEDRNEFGDTIPDQALLNLLKKINSYSPRVIGFDIYRPKPSPALAKFFAENPRLVGVAKVNDQGDDFSVPPPPALDADGLFGLSDVPIDDSTKMVRRLFLYGNVKGRNILAFPAALAVRYLEAEKITLGQDGDEVALVSGEKPVVTLYRLAPNGGGYHNRADIANGYQMLLNYRVPSVAHAVSRADVLAGRVDPSLIQNKLVLIGYEGESFSDLFSAPYTDRPISGVSVHAHAASDILAAALDHRQAIQYWSDPLTWLWIALWSLLTALAIWVAGSQPWSWGVGLAVLAVLGVTTWVLFANLLWVPLFPAVFAVLGTAGACLLIERSSFALPTLQPHSAVTSRTPSPVERATTIIGEDTLTRTEVTSSSWNQDWMGRTIGDRYRILRRLGGGGMGEVYLALDTRIDRQVAIKLIKLTSGAADEKLKTRFIREARVSAALESIHIIQVSDFGISKEGVPYYVMEYLRGKSLREVLTLEGRLDVNRSVRILLQICEGLRLAHEGITVKDENGVPQKVRVIHRDLKPENIFLIGKPELVKILDFGIAKLVGTESAQSNNLTMGTMGFFIGSSRYASPEQWSGLQELDARSDIYSLGMIAYEMLSGDNPFNLDLQETATNQMLWYEGHLHCEPQPLKSRLDCQNIPESLDQIVLRCLAKKFERRFSNVLELQQALKAAFPEL
jgi:eukaryotic-like serine/threonine-protein kinase